MTGVGSRGHVVFGPLKNIPHLFDGFVLAVTCLAPKQQDRGKLARKRSLNVSQNGDQTRTKIAHVQDTNDDHLQLDQPIFERGAGRHVKLSEHDRNLCGVERQKCCAKSLSSRSKAAGPDREPESTLGLIAWKELSIKLVIRSLPGTFRTAVCICRWKGVIQDL